MIKKLLLYILCFSVVFTAAFPTAAADSAQDPTFTFSDNSDGTVTLVSCVPGDATDIVLPENFGGKTVAAVGNRAFNALSGIKKVEFPESVKSIGAAAFSDCTELTDVRGGGVVNIGSLAFSNCLNLVNVYLPNVEKIEENGFLNTGIIRLSAADSPIYIGKTLYRFKGTVPASTSFKVADGTVSISDHAFEKQSGLTEITMGDSVKYIGSAAFARCVSLKTVNPSDSLRSVGAFAFSGTEWYNSQPDGVICVGRVAVGFKGDTETEITLNSGIISIAERCFYGCGNITSVTLPDGLETVGSEAFFGCTSLLSVSLPLSVTEIGYHALGFYGEEEEQQIPGFKIIAPVSKAVRDYARENGITVSDGKPYLPGDVNGDGAVTVLDAIMVLQHNAGLITLEGSAAAAADFTGDGQIGADDAVMVLRRNAELI